MASSVIKLYITVKVHFRNNEHQASWQFAPDHRRSFCLPEASGRYAEITAFRTRMSADFRFELVVHEITITDMCRDRMGSIGHALPVRKNWGNKTHGRFCNSIRSVINLISEGITGQNGTLGEFRIAIMVNFRKPAVFSFIPILISPGNLDAYMDNPMLM